MLMKDTDVRMPIAINCLSPCLTPSRYRTDKEYAEIRQTKARICHSARRLAGHSEERVVRDPKLADLMKGALHSFSLQLYKLNNLERMRAISISTHIPVIGVALSRHVITGILAWYIWMDVMRVHLPWRMMSTVPLMDGSLEVKGAATLASPILITITVR